MNLQQTFDNLKTLSKENYNVRTLGNKRQVPDPSVLVLPEIDSDCIGHKQILECIRKTYKQIIFDVTTGLYHSKGMPGYDLDNGDKEGLEYMEIMALYEQYFFKSSFVWAKHTTPNLYFNP